MVTEEEKERSKKYKKILTPFFCGFEKYTSKKRASAGIDRGPKNILIYLAFQDMRVYNMTTTNKGRAKGATNTPAPMRERQPPTQQYNCASLIIPDFS